MKYPRGGERNEVHPRNVTAVAYLQFKMYLSHIRSNLFRIIYLNDAWTSEFGALSDRAIRRLSEICAREGVGINPPEFTAFLH